MVETPSTVEVNVVMGAQLRAIVRSALIHVRNAVKDSTQIEDASQDDVLDTIDLELEKWPLSLEGDNDDTLPQWLFKRFGHYRPEFADEVWDRLTDDNKAFWQHEADAVRRAVGRGGFKTSPDENLQQPYAMLEEVNRKADADGGMVKGAFGPLDLKNTESLGEAIRIAVGAASTCWGNLRGAGVFESEKALDIATQLEHHVMAKIGEGLGLIGQRHQALADRLRSYRNAGHPTVSIQQAYSILAGTSTPEEYASALQPRPGNAAELGRPTKGPVGTPDPQDL